MGPWNSTSAVDHSLCSLSGLWRFPVAEASFQHQRQRHKSDFLWNHVRRTGAVTGYAYPPKRPFHLKLLKDITSESKQRGLCQLSLSMTRHEKPKSFLRNHVCQKHLHFETSFQLASSFYHCFEVFSYTLN